MCDREKRVTEQMLICLIQRDFFFFSLSPHYFHAQTGTPGSPYSFLRQVFNELYCAGCQQYQNLVFEGMLIRWFLFLLVHFSTNKGKDYATLRLSVPYL